MPIKFNGGIVIEIHENNLNCYTIKTTNREEVLANKTNSQVKFFED